MSPAPANCPTTCRFFWSSSRRDPQKRRRRCLSDAAHILAAIARRCTRRESRYAAAFDALTQLSGSKVDGGAVAELLAEPEVDPQDFEALDE